MSLISLQWYAFWCGRPAERRPLQWQRHPYVGSTSDGAGNGHATALCFGQLHHVPYTAATPRSVGKRDIEATPIVADREDDFGEPVLQPDMHRLRLAVAIGV